MNPRGKWGVLVLIAALLAAGGLEGQYVRPERMDATGSTASYATMTPPSGCAATSVIFFGSPVTVGPQCDTGFTYDPATDYLSAKNILTDSLNTSNGSVQHNGSGTLFGSGATLAWNATSGLGGVFDSGLRRVSPGLVGVTSGGSNLGSLQAGNVTAVGLGQVVGVTTVPQGANDGVTYGYIVVPYLNDGTYGTPSAQGVTLVGATALSATDKNTITWSALTNAAYYGVFRTSGGATNGLIGTTTALTFDDTGIVGGTGVPTTNTTGRVLVGDGSALAPSVAFASSPEMGLFKLSTYRLAIGAAGASAQIWDYANGQVFIPDNWLFGWGSNDASITRPAAGVNQFGNFPNATPQPRTIIVGESGSGTDIAGANGVIQSGAGTGSVAGSTLTFKTPTATTPGTTTAQTQNTRLEISRYWSTFSTTPVAATTDIYNVGDAATLWATNYLSRATLGSKSKALTDNTATDFASFTIADGYDYSGELLYKVRSVKGTAIQSLGATLPFTVTREGTTYTVAVNTIAETASKTLAAAAGTLTGGVTLACTAGVCTFTATFDTSQSVPDTMSISSRVNSTDAGLTLTFIP